MGRLDDVDLSLTLTRAEEAERLETAQLRLLQLRLVLGGQIGGKVGPPRASAAAAGSPPARNRVTLRGR